MVQLTATNAVIAQNIKYFMIEMSCKAQICDCIISRKFTFLYSENEMCRRVKMGLLYFHLVFVLLTVMLTTLL